MYNAGDKSLQLKLAFFIFSYFVFLKLNYLNNLKVGKMFCLVFRVKIKLYVNILNVTKNKKVNFINSINCANEKGSVRPV